MNTGDLRMESEFEYEVIEYERVYAANTEVPKELFQNEWLNPTYLFSKDQLETGRAKVCREEPLTWLETTQTLIH